MNFESGIFDAQEFDFDAGSLHARQASGGPAALSQQNFFIGINDVLSPGFTPVIFTLYTPWENLPPFASQRGTRVGRTGRNIVQQQADHD